MHPGHTRQADTREDRHLVPMCLQSFEVGTRGVVLAGAFGEEALRENPHVGLNRHHAARHVGRLLFRKRGPHGIQHRECHRHSRPLQKRASRKHALAD